MMIGLKAKFLILVCAVVSFTARAVPEVDVAVVGGGSAGFAAAWNAARLGSSVVLVERTARLGGTSVNGGVSNWEPVFGATGTPRVVYERLLRIPGAVGVSSITRHCGWDDSKTGPVFPGGLCEIDPALGYVDTLRRHGPGMKAKDWFRQTCHGVIFEPEAMSSVMAEMLVETGHCHVLTNVAVVSASAERRGPRVGPLCLSDGRLLRAKVVVDCCGVVCAAEGVPQMRSARPNGATLVYRIAPGVAGRTGEELAAVPVCAWAKRFPVAFVTRFANGEMAVNMLPTMDGREALRLGREAAFVECRRRVFAHWAWMKTRWPEFADWHLKSVASEVAYRETVRYRGDYVLSAEDVANGVRPEDEIAAADHAFDSHGGVGFRGELKAPYGIPYRCLVAEGRENMLMAGRIASFDDQAASSCRLSRTMMQLGEAAGIAAHLAAKRGGDVRRVSAAEIRCRQVNSATGAPRINCSKEGRNMLYRQDADRP